MQASSIRRRIFGRHALAAAALAACSALCGQAVAGCGGFDAQSPPSLPERAPSGGFGLMKAAWQPDRADFVRVGDRDLRDFGDEGIVGTWRFTFVSDGAAYPHSIPYGAVVDFGTVQWHGDGTEFMISAGRPPSSGDVCMGSWEQTGRSTYKLKHIALAWVSPDSVPPSTPSAYLGPAIIREVVTLNRARNAYEGTFTLDQYAKDEVTLLQHISGKVVGTRFSVD